MRRFGAAACAAVLAASVLALVPAAVSGAPGGSEASGQPALGQPAGEAEGGGAAQSVGLSATVSNRLVTLALTGAGAPSSWWFRINWWGSCTPVTGTSVSGIGGYEGGPHSVWAYSDSGCGSQIASAEFTVVDPVLTATVNDDRSVALSLANGPADWWFRIGSGTCTAGPAGSIRGYAAGLYGVAAFDGSGCATYLTETIFTIPDATLTATVNGDWSLDLALADGPSDWWFRINWWGTCTAASGADVTGIAGYKGGPHWVAAYSDSGCTYHVASSSFAVPTAALTATVNSDWSVDLALADGPTDWWFRINWWGTCTSASGTDVTGIRGYRSGTHVAAVFTDDGCGSHGSIAGAEFVIPTAALSTTVNSDRSVDLALTGGPSDWWFRINSWGTCTPASGTTVTGIRGYQPGTHPVWAYLNSGCSHPIANSSFTIPEQGDPLLTVGSITATSAVLTLSGRSGNWWLKQTAPVEQTCGPGESDFTHDLSDLSADTSYVYAAYSDSSCATLLLATPTFKTPPNAVAAVTDITPTTAKLTLANHSGNWRYKYTSPTGGECSREQTGTAADVVGLSGGTQYTFATYTDAACTAAIATAASFTTPSSGDRAPHEDVNGLSSVLQVAAQPYDIWSDGTTMWIEVPYDDKLYAYKKSDKTRDSAKDITVSGVVFWGGFWSDGTTRWMADFSTPPKLYAYKASDNTRQSTNDVTLHSDNNAPWGVWSDADTIWVSDSTDDKLYAYKKSDKTRDSAKDITASGHDDVSGIWSDGATMWMSDSGDDKLYAYKMSDGTRDSAKDFSLNSDNGAALGIWSDGSTMWVVDQTDKKVYAYHAFSADLAAIDIGTSTATLNLANNPSLWYYKANKSPHNTCSAQGVTGSSADLAGLAAGTTYIYTAYSDSGCETQVAATAVIEFTTKTGTLSLGSSSVTGQSYATGTAIATLTLPAATASVGSPTIAYTLTPSLPAGLTFNASNRTVTGTPTAEAASTIYTYAATSAGYASDDLVLTISVSDPVTLSGVSSTETTATLTIANRSGNWYYQADRGPDTSCTGPVSGATKALAGLTSGVAYAYTAYSDSGCTAALAPTATFTALQLTAGAPTATTNTLTIVGNTGTWRYKYTSPDGGTCSSAQTNATVSLAGLTKSTQYVFKAYKDSDCTTVAATASAFTTDTPSLGSSQIGHDKATITLTDWAVGTGAGKDGNWYYKADKGPHTSCSSAQTGASVALTGLAASETYTYTAYSNSGCSSTIAAASAFTTAGPPGGARDANKDISLHSDNDKTRGFWTNGTTLYVVDGTDDKIYAYQWSDKSRDSAKDFDTLKAAGNSSPTDLWSDGTTMWVLDPFDNKIYAYKMSDTARDAGKDHSVHGHTYRSQGLWSDGVTLWVSNYQDDKMYAYQWSDKSRDSGKDYSLTDGNGFPRSLWGNGVTMWVVDSEDDKLYAYNMSDQSRDSGKDISLASGNDRPTGIWSDGETIWVAEDDSDDNKLYAYRALPALIASSIASTTATVTLSAHTGSWWLKRTSPTGGTCTQGEADFSHALSDLTAGTAYTFTAYSASDCSSASEIESVSFTTAS